MDDLLHAEQLDFATSRGWCAPECVPVTWTHCKIGDTRHLEYIFSGHFNPGRAFSARVVIFHQSCLFVCMCLRSFLH